MFSAIKPVLYRAKGGVPLVKASSGLQTAIETLANQPNSFVSLQQLIRTGSLALNYSKQKVHCHPQCDPSTVHSTEHPPAIHTPSTTSTPSDSILDPFSNSCLSNLWIRNAQFLLKELPLRLAKRCRAFQLLPFIVGTNPHLHQVSTLYETSLKTLLQIPPIVNSRDEEHFDLSLSQLVQAHLHVIPILAQGFLESSKYISTKEINHFLDELIHARIGVRVLAEHHLALHRPMPNYVGIIDFALHPYQLIQKTYQSIYDMAAIQFGHVPKLVVQGHLDATMAYIPAHMEYILSELLKNSIRATMEAGHREVPPIQVTLVNGVHDLVIRIRDQGGGIPPQQLPRIYDYAYTTAHPLEHEMQQSTINGPWNIFAGQGYGLGTSRVYSRFFGGSLKFMSLHGHGCDVFLRLKKLDANEIDIQI